MLCSILFLTCLAGAESAAGEIATDSHLVVVNTGITGSRPIVDGEVIVFSSPLWPEPYSTVYYHDTAARLSVNTGILGDHWGVDMPYIAILSREWMLGDLNGDGDDRDDMLSCYNIETGEHTVITGNLRQLCWPCADNGRIVYALSERYETLDLNGDGDMDDICGFFYDVVTQESTYFADAFYATVFGNYIVYTNFGELFYHDITTNTSFNIISRSSSPQIGLGWGWMGDGDIIAMEVHETGHGGDDLNGDGDYFDTFTAYYDTADGNLQIITDIEGRFVDISSGNILIQTWEFPYRYYLFAIETGDITLLENYSHYRSSMEGDIIVGNDWHGKVTLPPWPTGVPNIMIYDVTSDVCVNTHIIGHLDRTWYQNFNGDIIVMVTFEANIPMDLNGDGDTDDHVVRYVIEEAYVEASVDIDPDTLNLKSKGRWVTCYIELPEGYDVNDIDVSTVLLEDSIHAEIRPSTIGDHDGDGIPDMMIKFDRAELEDMLFSGNFNLKVTGHLNDGTLFEGYSDLIRVINPP